MVFYGSQTGTGEEFANRLSKDAHRYGMKGMAADPEEYDMVMSLDFRWRSLISVLTAAVVPFKMILRFSFQNELSRLKEINNSLAIFCMATYGEGDPTDNAQDFYDLLQEGDIDLDGVNFTASISNPSSFSFHFVFLWEIFFSPNTV